MSNLVVNTNVQALNSHRSMKITSERGEKASEKLSSGLRINRAGDDAAGLAISEKMRNQIKGLNMASRNAQDGISVIQTAEGALQETHEMLKRMRELVIQGANDSNMSTEREKIAVELTQLINEIDSTAQKTEFNKRKLIDGTYASATSKPKFYLQVGANIGTGQFISFNIEKMTASAIGIVSSKFVPATFKGMSGAGIAALTSSIDAAIEKVSTQRANLGAIQNRLEHTIKNLDVSSENLSASESRIRDTDMAKEMMEFTKANVLSQAGISMLAQANQAPNNVLSLLS